jgi:hypothetical protein
MMSIFCTLLVSVPVRLEDHLPHTVAATAIIISASCENTCTLYATLRVGSTGY